MSDHLERLDTFANHWQAAMDDDLVSEVIAVIDGKPLRKSDLRAALNDVEQLQAGRIPLMTLRQTWRNGWMDRARADRQAIADSNKQCDAYERAFVRYMSEDPAEDDKDPYRPVDGPNDPAFEQQPTPTVAELHARCAHPSYEYATTQGPRKSWDGYDDPPEGDGWERNIDAGRDGWERFDYHEESYWRRLRPDATCDFPSCVHPDHQATRDGVQ